MGQTPSLYATVGASTSGGMPNVQTKRFEQID